MEMIKKIIKILIFFSTLIWVMLGIIYLSFSGNTYSLIPFGGVTGLLFMLAILFHLMFFVLFIRKIIQKIKGKMFWNKFMKIILSIVIFGDLCFAIGTWRGVEKHEETEKQGNILFNMIKDFEKEEGYYPESIDELRNKKGALPLPAFAGTEFQYTKLKEDFFYIKFTSIAWMHCSKYSSHDAKSGWLCVD